MNPRLPLTVREVPPNEELPDRPNDEPLDPNRDPLIELFIEAPDPPAAELPLACVPAVFPVLGPRALPVLPENECQLPSAFARVAPRPAGQPDERAFNEFERPAFEPAPFRAFMDELPPARPLFIPFERDPPYPLYDRPPP